MTPRPGAHALSARLLANRDALTLSVDLTVEPGETLALVGPNGAGKTTALELLAGLQRLESGHVRLGDRLLADPEAGVFLAAHRRNIGVVFQDGRLFPRLDACDNVAFGLRARGVRRRQACDAARDLLHRLGVAHLATRRPADLSGGEAQKVSIARALAIDPDMLLLDEPFNGLDVTAAADLRGLVRRQLAAFQGPRILVTHSPLEVMALADRLMVMEDGHVVQYGSPEQVRRRPRSRFVARFIGLNLVRGVLRRTGDATRVSGPQGTVTVTEVGLAQGTEVAAVIPPQAVVVSVDPPRGSARNVVTSSIRDIELTGDRARLTLEGWPPLTAEITAQAVVELRLCVGQRVWATVKATEIDVLAL